MLAVVILTYALTNGTNVGLGPDRVFIILLLDNLIGWQAMVNIGDGMIFAILNFMPYTYKISLQAEKCHPYMVHPLLRKDGSHVPWQEELYLAIVHAMARHPDKIFNMDDSGFIYTDPATKNQYLISFQD